MTIKEVSEKYGISQDTLRYYERVNVIPKVTRTSGGIRDYQEEDLRWVELAVCMRNAGLPIESLIEYQRLFRAGDSTIPARLELLNEQMDILQNVQNRLYHLLLPYAAVRSSALPSPLACDVLPSGIVVEHLST